VHFEEKCFLAAIATLQRLGPPASEPLRASRGRGVSHWQMQKQKQQGQLASATNSVNNLNGWDNYRATVAPTADLLYRGPGISLRALPGCLGVCQALVGATMSLHIRQVWGAVLVRTGKAVTSDWVCNIDQNWAPQCLALPAGFSVRTAL
jgi:hypothetical protein